MAIREIRTTEFDQECTKCGAVLSISDAEVCVGMTRENQVDSVIIPLPACPSCGSSEFLLRSPTGEEHPAPGSYGHLHRLMVDTLHAKLVKAGRLAQGLTPETAPIKEPSAVDMDRWFKDGLKLPPPPKTDGDGR